MENNNNTPKPLSPQKQDTPDPLAAAENNTDLSEEQDGDDIIHSRPESISEENKEQDADDAVHKNYKPAPDSAHENDEHDPDDMIHGKL